jgi:hypothetical protein
MSAVIAFPTDTAASPLPHAPHEPGASGLIHEVINPAHPWEIAVGRAVAEQLSDINGYSLVRQLRR